MSTLQAGLCRTTKTTDAWDKLVAPGRKARFVHYAVLTYAVQAVCHLHVDYSYLKYLESEALKKQQKYCTGNGQPNTSLLHAHRYK